MYPGQGFVEHTWGLARGRNTVIGDVGVAAPGSVNAAGTVNTAGHRVDVDFRRIEFAIDEVLGAPVRFRKVIVTKKDAAAPQVRSPLRKTELVGVPIPAVDLVLHAAGERHHLPR